MIFGKTKLELKVGIFVFVGLVLLSIFILSIGGFKTWANGYRVNFMFGFSNGVKVGAPVRFAGVDVGVVKNIRFFIIPEEKKTRVKIETWVKEKVKIPKDSTVWVNTLGLLGEKYIEIMPGKDYVNFLAANEELAGQDPISMQEVGALAMKVVTDADDTLLKINKGQGTIGKLLNDDTMYKEFEAFATDIRKHPWKLIWKTKENK
ncbi:MAG: MlaD family protein [Candidatus Omnitrophica bacterium]|nr:MlaD family protein [Candidatus Omnitrophota bacterium]